MPMPRTSPLRKAAQANKTPYAFLHVPLHLNGQAIGVLQVWLQPYVQAKNFAEFVTFLNTLTPYVEQHLQSRRLSNLVLETQRLQHLLRLQRTWPVRSTTLEVARLTANYGRDLAGCERTSVLIKEGGHLEGARHLRPGNRRAEERDGQGNGRLRGGPCRGRRPASSTRRSCSTAPRRRKARSPALLPRSPSARTDEIDILYFQLSHVVSAVICPMLDSDKEITGAIFCESTFEGYFDSAGGKSEVLPARRVTEWVATYSGRTLAAARDYQTLPFLPVSQRVRGTRLLLTGKKRNRFLLKVGVFAALPSWVSFSTRPAATSMGIASIQALNRAIVVPEISARIETVLVHEGDHVTKGQELARARYPPPQARSRQHRAGKAALHRRCRPRPRRRG